MRLLCSLLTSPRYDDTQAVFSPFQTVGREQLQHLLSCRHGTPERHHDFDVGKAQRGRVVLAAISIDLVGGGKLSPAFGAGHCIKG